MDDDKVLAADNTLRGIEALCDILYNEEAELDPYENEWKHLNKILDCFTQPESNGRVKTWNFETDKVKVTIKSDNTGSEMIYSSKKEEK